MRRNACGLIRKEATEEGPKWGMWTLGKGVKIAWNASLLAWSTICDRLEDVYCINRIESSRTVEVT